MAQVHYTTASISQWLNNFELFNLDPAVADRQSLTKAPWASRSIGSQMSNQGRALLNERNEHLKSATTPEAIQEVYFDIRIRAEQIDYQRPNP